MCIFTIFNWNIVKIHLFLIFHFCFYFSQQMKMENHFITYWCMTSYFCDMTSSDVVTSCEVDVIWHHSHHKKLHVISFGVSRHMALLISFFYSKLNTDVLDIIFRWWHYLVLWRNEVVDATWCHKKLWRHVMLTSCVGPNTSVQYVEVIFHKIWTTDDIRTIYSILGRFGRWAVLHYCLLLIMLIRMQISIFGQTRWNFVLISNMQSEIPISP